MELAIGLPLIIMMLWAMSNLFAGTWKECRDLIADYTMQIEVNNAMQRIVSDLNVASHADSMSNGRLMINSYVYDYNNKMICVEKSPIYYFKDHTDNAATSYDAIYRQRSLNAKAQPLTGMDILSDVNIIIFKRTPIDKNLWDIEIIAESRVSGHRYRLKTKVYTGGADQ